jgi:hypothetical protein
VDFVEIQADSLRCLIFDQLALHVSWSGTLRSIADATQGHLEYFRARSVMELPDPESDLADLNDPVISGADLAVFTCAVEWVQ